MTKLNDYIPEAHDEIMRIYDGYFPSKETTEITDYDFGEDIDRTLFEHKYEPVRTDPAYSMMGRECVDTYWVNRSANVTVKVTQYADDAKRWYYLKFEGRGRKVNAVWQALKEIERRAMA